MTKSVFMATSIDPEKVNEVLRECARDIILPYHGALEDHHVERKNDATNSKVTIADKESEEFLTEKLQALLPGSYVVGEEAAEENPEILDYLNDPEKAVWVIDPIDGTSNYARGDDTFCVIVALVADGKTQMGWIYDVRNDSMAFAQKGQGTFIDGQKTEIDPQVEREGSTGYAGYSFMDQVKNITLETLRCSGLEYTRIAKGEAVFSIYRMMKPWDHLAGTLLVEEAGGYVRKWGGSAYDPHDRTGGIISASNQEIWQEVRDLIPQKSLEKMGLAP